MDTEVAQLSLFGANLTTTQSAIGIRGSDFRVYTFIFDLRRVLGETLFEKYDAFKVYITNENFITGGAGNICTMFQNGLNLIQASYQGKQAGFETAVGVFSQSAVFNDGFFNVTAKPANTREFVFIKPNDTKITMTFSCLADVTAVNNLSPQTFSLTFAPYIRDKIYKNPFNYLYQNEIANFTLTTQILSAGATNAYGTMNSTFTTFNFVNVNMRQIIGTLWDKYDKFNLVCSTVGVGQTITSLNGFQRYMFFQIKGLQFINCLSTNASASYSEGIAYTPIFKSGVAVSTAEADCFEVPMSLNSFRKPESENVDLAFQLFSVDSGGSVLNLQMNQFSLTFAVVGIPL